jgi:hypothetical protein
MPDRLVELTKHRAAEDNGEKQKVAVNPWPES